jgi:hypothetical protein
MSVTMRQMLEAGVHFGHQTRYWNPKMAPFIFGHRNKIHIINLEKTLPMFNEAATFARRLIIQQGFHPVRRHQAPGPRDHGRGSLPLRHALHLPSLAGRHADQLQDREAVGQAHEGHGSPCWPTPLPSRKRKPCASSASTTSWSTVPGRHQGHGAVCPTPCSWWTWVTRRSPSPRPTSWASRSSAWWTPTTPPPAWIMSSPVMTTPTAPSASTPAASPTPILEGKAHVIEEIVAAVSQDEYVEVDDKPAKPE